MLSSSILSIFITTVSFLGWLPFLKRITKLSDALLPFSFASILGILEYFATLCRLQPYFTLALILGGIVSAITYCTQNYRQWFYWHQQLIYYIFFALLIASWFYTRHIEFSKFDDYAFWGSAAKTLFLTHHFVMKGSTLSPEHLTYTPGMSAFHYYFLMPLSYFCIPNVYYAQNVITLSALLVVAAEKSKKLALGNLVILVIMITIFYGAVFASLQVDFILGTYLFAILWIYHQHDTTQYKWWAIVPALIFLFLIKQIGIFISMVLILYFAVHITMQRKQHKYKLQNLIYPAIALVALLLVRASWIHYYQQQGFKLFTHAINVHNAIKTLLFWNNTQTLQAFWIYLKSITLGPGDRLNTPFIVWYLITIVFWFFIFRKSSANEKKQYQWFLIWETVVFLIYNVMLFLLQAIVFRIATRFHHTLAMMRYENIVFSALAIFTLFIFTKKYLQQPKIWNFKNITILSSLIVLILFIFRIQRVNENEKPHILYLLNTVEKNLPKKQGTLCIINDKQRYLSLKLTYALLPNYRVIRLEDHKIANFCDYILLQKSFNIKSIQKNYKRLTSLNNYYLDKKIDC